MKERKRIRDYGVIIGSMPPGKRNTITDVDDVKVGHVTLDKDDVKTGVTAILPHTGNLFIEKLIASSHVINGFGKSMGTIQIEELGTIETPIILTNTLSIGEASSGLIEYMLRTNKDIGKTTGSVNPIVCECNDSYLNDIRGRHIKNIHVYEAIEKAHVHFEEGSIGAGTGMSCYELKGGIGSSSRVMDFSGEEYTVGVLVLTNMGQKKDLIVDGRALGRRIVEEEPSEELNPADGSVIIILATDIPMTARQLKRICKRTIVGLNRTGSYIDTGSGEIVIAFTTANRVSHYEKKKIVGLQMLNENEIGLTFRAVAECTEEAILNSMTTAKTTVGVAGHVRRSLAEYIHMVS